MSLKEKIENNLVVFFLGALLTGFLVGVGAYKAILEIAQLDVVAENSYISKRDLETSFIEKSAYDLIKSENIKLKEAVVHQKRTTDHNEALLKNLSDLISDARNIRKRGGDVLVSEFSMWIQKGMQITDMIGKQTHVLFNNNVYFSNIHKENPSQLEIEIDIKQRIDQGIAILEGAEMILKSSAK